MIMCLNLSYLTHFGGWGKNPKNISLHFWKNLRHHHFVLRLSDLYKQQASDGFACSNEYGVVSHKERICSK